MPTLLTSLLLEEAVEAAKADWDESLHPRGEGGRFSASGGGKEAPPSRGASRLRWTPAGPDPKALARVAVQRARFAGEGSKTLAREAARAAIRAGAGKETKIRAAAVARAAVRREVGGAHMKRPEQEAELKQRFGAGRGRGGAGAGGNKPPVLPPQPVAPKPVIDLKPPAGVGIGGKEHAVIEQHLRESKVSDMDQIGIRGVTNASDSYRVTFEDGSMAMWKPASGAAVEQYRQNIRVGQDAQREAGAWEVAKLVGMHDLVPQTVVRDHGPRGHGSGSMQNFVPNSQVAGKIVGQPPFDGSRDFSRSAVFDFIIGHEDRHGENWMVNKSTGKLGLIDNGLAFPETTGLSPVRGFIAAAGGQSYNGLNPPKTEGTPADWAKPYVENKSAILDKLSALNLPPGAVLGVGARIDMVSKWNTENGWLELTKGAGANPVRAAGAGQMGNAEFMRHIQGLLGGGRGRGGGGGRRRRAW